MARTEQTPNSSCARFQSLPKRLLAVPKSEADRQKAKEAKQKQLRKSKG